MSIAQLLDRKGVMKPVEVKKEEEEGTKIEEEPNPGPPG
jgi:hypothetical protein